MTATRAGTPRRAARRPSALTSVGHPAILLLPRPPTRVSEGER